MNKRQKIVQEAFLDNEEAVIKRLKSVYNQSLKDITAKTKELQDQINTLDALQGMTSDPDELAKLKSMEQAKIYQKQYQDALKKQISSIMDNMQVEEFKTVSEYLNKCYEEGFLGTMYDLHGQNIPLILPIDQEAIVRAVQLDSKISNGLYSRLGEDVALLKKKITAQVSRGISTGMTFAQVAQQLAAYTNIGFNNAVRIARTEGHRIQVQSGMDACYKAKEKGCDVVKQWDSTMDKRTRRSHQHVDGEIKEMDEPFSNGLMFPGDPSGGASEVVNCRCALLQRARWALDEDELETLKERAEYYGLDKNDSFDDFKKKYLKAADEVKADEEKLKTIRARREAWKARQAERSKKASMPDFDSLDRKQLEHWVADNLKTKFEDTKGASVEYIREATKVISELENRMGGTLDGLSVRFGGLPNGVHAKYDDKTNTILVKKSGSLKSFVESQEKTNARSRIKLKKDYYATTSYSGTLWHELGHAVDMDTGQALSRKLGADKELELKSVKVSVYAGTTQNVRVTKRSEAWAENFAAYMDKSGNEDKVPVEIRQMIEDYFKSKK